MADTQAVAGFDAHLYVSSDGTTYVEAGELQNCTLTRTAQEISANSNVDTTYEQAIPGRIKWTLNGTLNFVGSDSGQALIETQYTARANLYCKLVTQKVVGRKKWTGNGTILDFSWSGADGQTQQYSFSITGRGALTLGTVVSGDIS